MEGEAPIVPTEPLNRDIYIIKQALSHGGAAENLTRDNQVLSELLHSPQTIIQRKTRDELVNHILTTGDAEQRRVLVDQITAETERGRGSLMEKVEQTAVHGRTAEERQWALVTLAQAAVSMEDHPDEQNQERLFHLKGRVNFRMIALARMIQSDLPLSEKDNAAIMELLGNDSRRLPFEGFDTCAVLSSEANPAAPEKIRTRVYGAAVIALHAVGDGPNRAKLEAIKEQVESLFPPGVQAYLKDGLAFVGHENNIEHLLPEIFDSGHGVRGLVETMRSMAEETDSETRRSIASFAAIVLELYAKRQKYGGKDVYKMDLRFDRMILPRTTLAVDLPEDTAAVLLLTNHCEGPEDKQLWNTHVVAQLVEDDRSVRPYRMNRYIAGQKPDGRWELAGSYSEILEEQPMERIMRIIDERCQGEAGQSVEARAQIAAEEVLSRVTINSPIELDDRVKRIVEDLDAIKPNPPIKLWEDREGFIALPEFQKVVKSMAEYLLANPEEMEKIIRRLVFREYSDFYEYNLDYDPLEKVRIENGYQKIMEISFSDQDRQLD